MSLTIDGKINIESFDLGPTGSIQLQFAKLQLLLAETSKGQAMDYINSITEAQEKSREVAEMIQKCRELQSQAKEGKGEGGYCNNTSGEVLNPSQYEYEVNKQAGRNYGEYRNLFPMGAENHYDRYMSKSRTEAETQLAEQYTEIKNTQTAIPADILDFMKANGLAVSSAGVGGCFFDADQWDTNIKSLQNYQEQIGTDTQQKMVFVSDFMGQYNSYIQGASTAVQQSNQTLSTLARGQ